MAIATARMLLARGAKVVIADVNPAGEKRSPLEAGVAGLTVPAAREPARSVIRVVAIAPASS